MASVMKKVVIALGALVAACVVLFAVLIAVVVHGDHAARAKADALCGGLAVGSQADAALERARHAGASTRDPHWHPAEDGGDELLVSFPAALPLTGYLCSISARDGRVTATHVQAVD